jgi:hypothetical protein
MWVASPKLLGSTGAEPVLGEMGLEPSGYKEGLGFVWFCCCGAGTGLDQHPGAMVALVLPKSGGQFPRFGGSLFYLPLWGL